MNEKIIASSYESDFHDISGNVDPMKHPIKNVLDIGCGIAGWECFLAMTHCKIYLIDKTKVDKNIYYGYKKKTAFYNSMEIAKKNLIANAISEKNIFLQEATEKNEILFDEKFDLIVSFISCGFHYPVETYLDQIYEKLNKGGSLIIDIRKHTPGFVKIIEKFGKFETIKEEQNYLRVVVVK